MNNLVISENDEIIYNGETIDNSKVNHDFIILIFNQLIKKDINLTIDEKSSYGLLFLELKNTVESEVFQKDYNDRKSISEGYKLELETLEEEIKKI